ncbi:MAG: hypothetical protein J6Q16_03730, partial [Clostridia bacterium]|nr:hypothetical protein [Clostridia bacterium]
MKKRLYITVALVLCAGILVTGALLRGKPDDITPDSSQINDTQTPDDTNKPYDPVISDTPAPPARDNNKDNSPDNNDPADNTKP